MTVRTLGRAVIHVRPLAFVDEGPDGAVVGVPGTDNFATLPSEGVALLRRLDVDGDLDSAREWYEAEYGEPVDLDDFVAVIGELGFLDEHATPTLDKVRYQALARAFFSSGGAFALALLCVIAVVLLWRTPWARPGYRNLFISNSLILTDIIFILGQMPGYLLHETGHALAGRRLGLPSTLRVSRRLIYLVLETRLIGLAGVPRNKRYLPYLAGGLVDVGWYAILISLSVGLRAAHAPTFLTYSLRAVAFTTLLRLAWQLLLFVKTDLYFVLANLLRCSNLHTAAMALIRTRCARLLRRDRSSTDLTNSFSERDLSAARWFAPLIVVGYALAISIWLFVGVPALAHYGRLVIVGLTTHGSASTEVFWDAFLAVTLGGAQLVALAYLMIRGKRMAVASRP